MADFIEQLCLCFRRLEDVLMQENRLYLVFEFLSMDLKKYMDSIPNGNVMEPMLVKVNAGIPFFHLRLFKTKTDGR